MYRPSLIPAAAIAVATAGLSLTANAADNVAPVTVTATRSAQTADESLSSVSVVTREEIERSQATSMAELLGREPGVDFTRNGGRGTNSSIFLRGTESNHVLVLIDGVEVGSATSGTASFEDLPLANVERIEIVRGPRSSLYGSRAIGGVIQIFTRDGEGAHATVSAGSHDRREGAAGYGFNSGGTSFSVNVSAEKTDGIDSRDNNFVQDGESCGSAFTSECNEPDDDGYKNQSVNINASKDFTDEVTVSGRVLATDSEVEFDGNSQNSSENEQRVYSARVNAKVMSNWSARLQLSRSEDKNDNFIDGDFTTRFDTTRDAFSLQNEITLGTSHVVSIGLDAESAMVDSTYDYEEDERDTTGVYVQHQWIGHAWSTEFSLRQEHYDNFDAPTTGGLAVGYRFSPTVQAFASYGTAFRAPTFNELYFPGFGNPDLESEESTTVEAGLRGSRGSLNWETAAYSTAVDELIVNDGGPKNVQEARINGVEISLGMSNKRWDGGVSLDLKDTENLDTGGELPRRSQFGLKGDLTRRFGRFALGADVKFQGDRFDDTENNIPLDAYGLLDLRASWRFAADWTTRLKVSNVTDTDYQLADTYNTLGRTWRLEVAWRPGSSG